MSNILVSEQQFVTWPWMECDLH